MNYTFDLLYQQESSLSYITGYIEYDGKPNAPILTAIDHHYILNHVA